MIAFWSRHRWLSAVLVGAGVLLLVHMAGATSTIRTSDGTAMYTALITGSAAIAVLGLTPMSIVVSLSSPRVQTLLTAKGDDVRRSLVAAVLLHLATAGLAAFLLAIDSAKVPLVNARSAALALFAVALDATCRVSVDFFEILRLNQITNNVISDLPKLPTAERPD